MDYPIKIQEFNPIFCLIELFSLFLQNQMHLLLFMEYKNITDLDFIPKEYCSLEMYSDLYQIAYGAIYKSPSYERVHDIIVLLAKQTQSKLSLKAKLNLWESELSKIVNQIKRYQKKDTHVEVIVPFTSYYQSSELTLSIYEYAKVIIQELQKDNTLLEVEPSSDTKPIPSIYSLFVNYIVDFQETYIDEFYINEEGALVGETLRDCYEIIFDELIRRNLRNDKELEKCGLFKLIPDLPPFSPSNHYNNENAFVELFISKEEHLTNKDLVESVPIISHEQVKAEDNKKVRCGVLYSLLKDKIGDDYSLSAIINYCCNIEYNKKIRQRNTNTIDKYIRLYKKRDLQKGSTDSYELQPLVIEKVKRIIVEYDLEIPNGL